MPIIIKNEMVTVGGRCPKRYKCIKKSKKKSIISSDLIHSDTAVF